MNKKSGIKAGGIIWGDRSHEKEVSGPCRRNRVGRLVVKGIVIAVLFTGITACAKSDSVTPKSTDGKSRAAAPLAEPDRERVLVHLRNTS
jgi:hypothetical protein